MRFRKVAPWIALAVIASVSRQAAAANFVWQGGDGSFNNGSLWKASDNTTGVVPGTNDAAFFNTIAANYTVTLPVSDANAYAITHGTVGNVYFRTDANLYT